VTKEASTLTLDALAQADAATLRQIWREARGTAPPRTFTARLMRLALAWEMQAAGAADETAKTRLAWKRIERARTGQMAGNRAQAALRASVADGTRILKQWAGATHEVLITENGAVIWSGQSYSSLSAVAGAMTGTNRNGPKFFGLREGADP